jgi:protein-S-isoprenylcysteine O-methyltransferase Ste14
MRPETRTNRQSFAWFVRLAPFADLLGRAALVGYFSVLGTLKGLAIWRLIRRYPHLNHDHYLDLAADCAGLLFIALVLGTTIIRLKPLQSAEGWEPRASSFMGAFLTVSLGAFPTVEAGAPWRITSISLIVIGWLLSAAVLAHLGRSFSITAQARRLVTTGPYAVVRHPLYLCEEIAVIGVMLMSLSFAAVLIVAVQWMIQLRRMSNEERVLRSAFPEYAAYAAQTPKIIPCLRAAWPIVGKTSTTQNPRHR